MPFCSVPCTNGVTPSSSDVRARLQTGEEVCASVNTTPAAASASALGECAVGNMPVARCQAATVSARCWSVVTSSTLGRRSKWHRQERPGKFHGRGSKKRPANE
eukprot:scaffold84377_cov75-Phaeocystis_antarctica.AAC.2